MGLTVEACLEIYWQWSLHKLIEGTW